MRRLMNLSPVQKITKKFLRETMTMSEYEIARKEYGEKLRVLLEEDVPTHEPPSEAVDADASQAVHAPAEESLPVDPSVAVSSSTPGSAPANEGDASERDRQRLRAEVATWPLRVSQAEIEHIITHHPYSRARTLIWKARRPASDATPIEAAAD
jgi:hypothetical protein